MGNYILLCQSKLTPAVNRIPSARWLLEPQPAQDTRLLRKFQPVHFFTSMGTGDRGSGVGLGWLFSAHSLNKHLWSICAGSALVALSTPFSDIVKITRRVDYRQMAFWSLFFNFQSQCVTSASKRWGTRENLGTFPPSSPFSSFIPFLALSLSLSPFFSLLAHENKNVLFNTSVS